MYGKRVKKFNSSSGITYKAVMESVEELAKMLLH